MLGLKLIHVAKSGYRCLEAEIRAVSSFQYNVDWFQPHTVSSPEKNCLLIYRPWIVDNIYNAKYDLGIIYQYTRVSLTWLGRILIYGKNRWSFPQMISNWLAIQQTNQVPVLHNSWHDNDNKMTVTLKTFFCEIRQYSVENRIRKCGKPMEEVMPLDVGTNLSHEDTQANFPFSNLVDTERIQCCNDCLLNQRGTVSEFCMENQSNWLATKQI